MLVPLLDLKLQFQPLRERILKRIEEVADSQQFILGPEVEACEEEVRAYCGAQHAIGVSSGTDALLAILMALGIGQGDAVITSPYSFFATAGGIARAGARPIFVDIDPHTYNLLPAHLERLLGGCRIGDDGAVFAPTGERVRAIMPVHLFGLVSAMDEIGGLAREFRLPLIEDAAQALGAEFPSSSGKRMSAGAIGDFGYFSFFPSKNLGAFGDAGMVVCQDAGMATKLRTIRNHGMEERYFHPTVGGNFRLDALQAAILRLKLPYLDEWSSARRANASFYRAEIRALGLAGAIQLPHEPYAASGLVNHHIYNQFLIRVARRDELCAWLGAQQIGHAIYYPVPLHLQKCFASLGHREGDFPEAERAARESLALPIYPELTPDQKAHVVAALAGFVRQG